MQHATWIVCLAAALVSSFSSNVQAQSDGGWGVVLNGRAVHMNASGDWNEDNWGLGMEREFSSKGPWVKMALVNGFEDSMGDTSYMAGGDIRLQTRRNERDLHARERRRSRHQFQKV